MTPRRSGATTSREPGGQGGWRAAARRPEADSQSSEATRPRRPDVKRGAADGWERSPKRQRRGLAAIINQYKRYPLNSSVQWYCCRIG